ncbi:MAG: hypothetical protein HY672_00910 [Chloroflexi bacterium]|nr:hypothetical protein [Chloroflexota bacterium]
MSKQFRKWLPLVGLLVIVAGGVVVWKRYLKRGALLGLLVVALWAAGGCASDETTKNANYVLGEMEKASTPAGPIELEGKTLVHAADLPDLVSKVNSVSQESDKIIVVRKYLIFQDRIDCILDGVEDAALNDKTIKCEGKVLVEKKGEQGLLGVSEMLEAVNTRENELAKREYLTDYLDRWDELQQIKHVEESLAQMKRTNAIPVFGPMVRAIHRFPIMYEGEELVPKKDVSDLLDQFRALNTDEARRALVAQYLEK